MDFILWVDFMGFMGPAIEIETKNFFKEQLP
jgi:hypothetical protein